MTTMNDVDLTLNEALNSILRKEYTKALSLLSKATETNDHNPKIHNLLGILYEHKGDVRIAMRHYRAAYVLDGSFLPASDNMIRLGSNLRGKPNDGLTYLTLEERRNGRKDEA